MGVLKKLASQTLIYGSSTILSRLLNVLFLPILTNRFPKAIYGVYVSLYAWVSLFNVFLTFGMETTLFRFIQDQSNPKKVYNQAFYFVLSLLALFMAIALPLREEIAGWMKFEGEEHYLLLLFAIISLDVLAAIPKAMLRHKERSTWFGFIMLVNVIINLTALLIFVVYLEWEIEYVFVANIIASAVVLLMSLWKNLPGLPSLDWPLLRNMLDYSFFIMIAGFAGIMNETLDRIMIPQRWPEGGVFKGIVESGESLNGIYGANYKVAMFIALATTAFRYAAEPFFFKEAGAKDSPKTFARVFHYFMMASLAGFLLISSFAAEIMAFDLFGLINRSFVPEEYWSGQAVIPILLAAYIFNAAYINISIWFKITKQTRFAILFTGTGALITVTVLYFGIPSYGYMAGAWATLFCYLVMSSMVYYVGQKYFPVPYKIGRLLVYALIILAAFFLNQQIGATDGFYLAAFSKIAICLASFGIIFLIEKQKKPIW
ncbi:MAG: oligosaccharide flippase family protein [Bacteroidota bacterium]